MAEGSYRKESEGYNVEDMDEGSDEVGEEDMVEGNDYEEFGAFGGYGALTSFDIRILRAFGSLGPGFRILAVRPLLGHLLALGLLCCDVREGGRRGPMKAGAEGGRTAQLTQTFPLLLGEAGVGGGRRGAGRRLGQHRGSYLCRAICLPLPCHALPCPPLPSPPLLCPALPSPPWSCRMSPGNWKTLCWPELCWRHFGWIQKHLPMRRLPVLPT